ncbi:MAG: hypothetical protein IE916_00535 [Epsilonproteobacteria bacterium]|nr:hypothetical protein [Campylobacterota bacterium]
MGKVEEVKDNHTALDEVRIKVYNILKHKAASPIQFMDAEIYLVDKETLNEILLMENAAKGILAHSKGEVKDPFFTIAKIINPSLAAYKYVMKTKHKYKNLTNPVKVRREIEGEFIISERKKKKLLKESLEKGDISEEKYAELLSELEQECEIDRQNLKTVVDNFDDYDVIISRFKEKTYYPVLYYTLSDKSSHDTHLRASVPNILFFDDSDEDGGKRSDSKTDKIVKNYFSIGDSIFYKRKDEV